MIRGHYFRPIRHHSASHAVVPNLNNGGLPTLLSCSIVERFGRISDVPVVAIPVARPGPEDADDPPPNPGHPACAEFASSDYCRESWQYHLAQLARRPRTHWHKCDYDRFCAIVPIVHQDRCLAVVKLACPSSMPEEEFERHVELLDILVEGFVIGHVDLLRRLSCRERATVEAGEPPPHGDGDALDRDPSHPQVRRALQYIKEHLSDPKLTVNVIAHSLEINPHYLSHLFVEQVGQRMSHFIAARRVELAGTLLVTTDWQVKRIARETGHANPNWFCYVFRVSTGLTPLGYRRRARRRS